MISKNVLWSLAALWEIGCLYSCIHDQTARMQAEIDLRLKKFQSEHQATCLKEQLERASRIADSILLAEALAANLDTATVLNRLRPARPEALEVFDSVEIKPIFQDSF